ncbi:tRNA lysidine(34) synthetase TilS [Cesiribacter andamanensis]|uniref:tRNA(Ile)-lysidine synthase n=1 Tax=Cesiribacter andamanensis AMV16 TaxID=1279009 RepID=M7N7M4_9BACT|nr:tRNA lysidine(34) synthetase TilS [Cesiribacter andamanensis]EMR03247.1 tRNA(Ile)-lysidine synthase [Cesiribacter andamanensis AMV16]
MQEKFLAFIREKELLQPGQPVLLAVSGGLDSVAMAHLFQQCPYPFALAHANFGLRAEESEGDAHFVEALARQLGVAFHTTRLPAASEAEVKGVSIQMAARDLRYQWFGELCRQEGYLALATAHHLSDQAEGLLLNLSRGTGLAGLHGIAPKRPLLSTENSPLLIRPLLFTRRDELEAWATAQGIRWREDSSNASPKYRRNLIRQQVIPPLKSLNPQLEEGLQELASQVRAAEGVLKGVVDALHRQVVAEKAGHTTLSLPPLLAQPEPQYLLGELLQPWGFGWAEAGAILHSLQRSAGSPVGKEFSSATHRLVVDREQLVITPLGAAALPPTPLALEQPELQLGPWHFRTRRLPAKGYRLLADPLLAALDLGRLQFPLLLRPVQPGDRFQPLGMRGKKKLSDFMIDQKIPLNLKDELLVLQSGTDIVWVVGHRIDERYKVSGHTAEIFEIRGTHT